MPKFEENRESLDHVFIDDDSEIEHIPKNEIVEQFRTDIFYWFHRFQAFYTRAITATTDYRFAHVELITRVYNELITAFGDDIEAVHQLTYEYVNLVIERTADLGGDNECLVGVAREHGQVSLAISEHVSLFTLC